jgi:hypothetical protein
MTPEELLQECETLAHHGRMYRMVELGRLAVQDASIRELIATLTGGNVYERTLALQSCNGSRNSTQALQALSDPSRSVRSLALSLVPMLCSDTEIQSALDTISNDLQVVILTKDLSKNNSIKHQGDVEVWCSSTHRGSHRAGCEA